MNPQQSKCSYCREVFSASQKSLCFPNCMLYCHQSIHCSGLFLQFCCRLTFVLPFSPAQETQGETPGSFLRQPQPQRLYRQCLRPHVQIYPQTSIQPSAPKGASLSMMYLFISSHTLIIIVTIFFFIYTVLHIHIIVF